MGDNSNSSEKRGRHLKAAPENERPEQPEKKKKTYGLRWRIMDPAFRRSAGSMYLKCSIPEKIR